MRERDVLRYHCFDSVASFSPIDLSTEQAIGSRPPQNVSAPVTIVSREVV